jgi:AAA family ATP:ADP antiporter
MAPTRTDPLAAVVPAMIGAGAVSAQFIAGKATRDALYLAHLDVTSLPAMVVAAAAFSIGLVALNSRALRGVSPSTFVPFGFMLNAALLVACWALAETLPPIGARVTYLLISGFGPMLGSGFWLLVSERFDPHTARRQFGRIAAVGTLSGLGGALLAERVGSFLGMAAMLPFLAAISVLCAWQTRRLATLGAQAGMTHVAERSPELAPASPQSGIRALAHASYLHDLAALVLLGTTGAALVDYVFKARAMEAFGRGESLLGFFATYYAATSLLSFLIQTSASAVALQKLGLAWTTSTASLALFVGGLGGLVVPGFVTALIARGGEAVLRGSLFRVGYEIFYTPIPSAEKRAAKSAIDVGVDRLGDAVGGGLLSLLLLLPASRQYSAILAAAVVCAGLVLLVARRLNRGYIKTLERSLINRAIELDLSDAEDLTTKTTILRTLDTGSLARHGERRPDTRRDPDTVALADPEIQELVALRSRKRERIVAVLRQDEVLPASLVPRVVSLLAWDAVANEATRALQKAAEDRVGALVDALIDPNQPFAVRRRLARVFSICVSQRAADGLMLGLADLRFEVRFQCGRSLAAIVDRNPLVRVDAARIFDVVRREVAVGRPVWESQRLLEHIDDDRHTFVDEFLKDRAGQSLAHVFTLLALVLPARPLQIAYRGLHTDDPTLRGTALEYLEGVLPQDIRERLWPFLEESRSPVRQLRPTDAVLADLLHSNESILLNIAELRRRATAEGAAAATAGRVDTGRTSGV